MEALISILTISLLFFFTHRLLRGRFYRKRNQSEKLTAVVVEYRREKIKSMRTNFSKLDYPYARILEEESDRLICLHHASSGGRHFEIGEEVEVFWYDGKLVYWYTYSSWFNHKEP